MKYDGANHYHVKSFLFYVSGWSSFSIFFHPFVIISLLSLYRCVNPYCDDWHEKNIQVIIKCHHDDPNKKKFIIENLIDRYRNSTKKNSISKIEKSSFCCHNRLSICPMKTIYVKHQRFAFIFFHQTLVMKWWKIFKLNPTLLLWW